MLYLAPWRLLGCSEVKTMETSPTDFPESGYPMGFHQQDDLKNWEGKWGSGGKMVVKCRCHQIIGHQATTGQRCVYIG